MVSLKDQTKERLSEFRKEKQKHPKLKSQKKTTEKKEKKTQNNLQELWGNYKKYNI